VAHATYQANTTNEDALYHHRIDAHRHLFLVADGHGGPAVARHLQKKCAAEIVKRLEANTSSPPVDAPQALYDAFVALDEQVLDLCAQPGEESLVACGACLVVAFFDLTPRSQTSSSSSSSSSEVTRHRLTVAGCGDCRAVLGVDYRGKLHAVTMSKEHNARGRLLLLLSFVFFSYRLTHASSWLMAHALSASDNARISLIL
jgi:serine/threonine protein phosphatase PrpC